MQGINAFVLGIIAVFVCSCAADYNTHSAHPQSAYQVSHSHGPQPHVLPGAQGFLYYYHPGPYDMYEQKKDDYSYAPGLFAFFVLPVLALLGASYLVPVSVTGRSFNDATPTFLSDRTDLAHRMTQVYNIVQGSHECLHRILCDLGATRSRDKEDTKDMIMRVLKFFDPGTFTGVYKYYEIGLKTGNCKPYDC